jgi:hypothetical protein
MNIARTEYYELVIGLQLQLTSEATGEMGIRLLLVGVFAVFTVRLFGFLLLLLMVMTTTPLDFCEIEKVFSFAGT